MARLFSAAASSFHGTRPSQLRVMAEGTNCSLVPVCYLCFKEKLLNLIFLLYAATLQVDGEIRQKGSTADMIFKIPFFISHISSLMTLLEGDVILTGNIIQQSTPFLSFCIYLSPLKQ